MSEYPASGILFQNDRKQNDRQPDYTGNIELNSETVTDLWNQLQEGVKNPKANLAGWRKTSKGGRPFLSLRGDLLRERKEKSGYQAPSGYQNNNGYRPSQSSQDLDDEIPF